MLVLGIDPGFGRCGVALIEKTNGKEHIIFSDCIETATGDAFAERLAAVAAAVVTLLKKYEPDCMAIEKLYFAKNQKTAMQVAEVRGALIQIAAQQELPVFEYAPGQVKSAIAGSGSADKKQIERMLHLLVNIEKPIRYDDEYDAIAIGLTHLAHTKGTAIVI